MVDFDKTFEEMSMECDECGIIETFQGTFLECIEESKENGWRTIKDKVFEHYCNDCKEFLEDDDEGGDGFITEF